ncbi:hypothetical protein JCM10213_006665, partial [Rhodosporidiobolus nylandii]
EFFQMLNPQASHPQEAQAFIPQPQQAQPVRPSPTPSRRPSDRPRLRNASSSLCLEAQLDFSTPTKPGRERRIASVSGASGGAGGHTLTRTPTKEALRYMPY